MFIGGVSQETNEEDIKNYFMQYGNVSNTGIVCYSGCHGNNR